MKLLLDTHAFIWWDLEPDRLSTRVLALFQDPTNELLLVLQVFGRCRSKYSSAN